MPPPVGTNDTLIDRPASWPLRAWLAVPDWAFRVVGAGFFFGYAWLRMRNYPADFPNIGPYIFKTPGDRTYIPIVPILVDVTFLLIALSFAVRLPPRSRAARPAEILVPLVAAFWPLLPFFALPILLTVASYSQPDGAVPMPDLQATAAQWAQGLEATFSYGQITMMRFSVGITMLCAGLLLDVWGYATLCRSLSIVAEARVLKTRGPYRLIRHPIYLGQFLAQAGVWLVLFHLQAVWVVFYVAFVVMQLYRSRLEDRVLERAFGDAYLAWKRRTFWFV